MSNDSQSLQERSHIAQCRTLFGGVHGRISLKIVESLVEVLSDDRVLPIRPSNPPPMLTVAVCATSAVPQAITRIKAIAESKDEVMLADYLSSEAQTLIDLVHEAIDLSALPPQLRKKCLNALCQICGRRVLLPKSLQIPLCYDRLSLPWYRGGFADAWKGEYRGLQVAAKVVRVYSTSDLDKIARRFCKEVMTWNTLNHSNVLPLLGATISNQQFVMVSEWMANGNINEFIKVHRDADRLELLKEVAKGLIYVHDQEIVHGDLKGANILIDPNGYARIADFGFLAIISDPTNPTVSSSLAIGGTIRWMSPELFLPKKFGLKDARPTQQSDCYALGMVVYEVLSGKVPFASVHYCIVIPKVIEGERPGRPNGSEGAQFTDDLWRTLGWCWAAQPQCRPTVTTVLGRLEGVSMALKTPSQQSDGGTGSDEDDPDTVRDPSRVVSRFNPRFFVAFPCGILCLSRLEVIFRKALPSERGGTNPDLSQQTTFTQYLHS